MEGEREEGEREEKEGQVEGEREAGEREEEEGEGKLCGRGPVPVPAILIPSGGMDWGPD